MILYLERQFAAVTNAELVENAVKMVLHGLLAYGQFFCNLRVAAALRDQLNDFLFAGGQPSLGTRGGSGR